MIKLIVTDVDGTLLDNDSMMTEDNKKALLECKKKGKQIVLATGKSVSSILPLIKMLELDLPQITLNGTVVTGKNQEVVKAVKIDPVYYFKLLDTIKKKKHNPLVALSGGRIVYDHYDPVFYVFDKIHEHLYKVEKLEDDHFARDCVSVAVAIKETDPLEGYLRRKFSPFLQLVRSGEYFFDIINLNASKGKALEFILEQTGIKKEEVIVFGDSYNDLSLFEMAKIRVAVKNSYQEVLEKADFITETNYNSGVGKALYKFVLNSS